MRTVRLNYVMAPGDSVDGRQLGLKTGIAVLTATFAAMFLVIEIGARIWVALVWAPEDVERATALPTARGGYVQDSIVGYRLQPGFASQDANGHSFTHNRLGFRGSPLPSEGDSALRVAVLGASTIYGIFVSDEQTSSAILQALLSDRYRDRTIEVFNAGVPGYTSRETRNRVPFVLENLDPDIVFIIDGRNELFPELFNGYSSDYSHYRDFSWQLSTANRAWRKFFRVSRAAMLLIPNGGGLLGYSGIADAATYGNIRFANRPNMDELRINASDPDVLTAWTTNVGSTVDLIAEHGATPVLVQMPFLAKKYGSGVLPRRIASEEEEAEFLALLEDLVIRNNAVARKIAEERGVLFLETDAVVSDQFLIDDCHFTPDGERAFAGLMAAAVDEILRRRLP